MQSGQRFITRWDNRWSSQIRHFLFIRWSIVKNRNSFQMEKQAKAFFTSWAQQIEDNHILMGTFGEVCLSSSREHGDGR